MILKIKAIGNVTGKLSRKTKYLTSKNKSIECKARSLFERKRSKYSQMRIYCPKCDKAISSKDCIYIKSRPKKCKTCSTKIKYGCEICRISWNNIASVYEHVASRCGKSPKFHCAHCNLKTWRKSNLIKHLHNAHRFNYTGTDLSAVASSYSNMTLYCPKCKKELGLQNTKSCATTHSKYCETCETKIIYCCNGCNKFCNTLATIRQHRRWYCGKSPNFNCPQCKYKTYLKFNLESHIKNKHKNKLTSHKTDESNNHDHSESKLGKDCPNCGKKVRNVPSHLRFCKK